MANLV